MIAADDERSIVFYPVPPHAFPRKKKKDLFLHYLENIFQLAWVNDHLISICLLPKRFKVHALRSVFLCVKEWGFPNQITGGQRVMSNNSW